MGKYAIGKLTTFGSGSVIEDKEDTKNDSKRDKKKL